MDYQMIKLISRQYKKSKKINSRKPIDINNEFERCPFCDSMILKSFDKEKICPVCLAEIFDEDKYIFESKLPDNNKITIIRIFDFIRDMYTMTIRIEPGMLSQGPVKNETIAEIDLKDNNFVKMLEDKGNTMLYVGFSSSEGNFNDSILINKCDINNARIVFEKLNKIN